jgi:hypothetical protein
MTTTFHPNLKIMNLSRPKTTRRNHPSEHLLHLEEMTDIMTETIGIVMMVMAMEEEEVAARNKSLRFLESLPKRKNELQ